MKVFGYLIILILLIVGISFAVLNADIVTFHYYLGTKQLPLSLLLILSFGAGLLLGLFFMGIIVIGTKTKNRRLRKRLQMAEKEINNLRTIPIKDEH